MLCKDFLPPHLALGRFDGTLPRELRLHYPALHPHILLKLVLFFHVVLPPVVLGGVVQVLLVALQDLVLLRLLLLEEGVLPQHGRGVLAHDRLFLRLVLLVEPLALHLRLEGALGHPLRLHLLLQPLQLVPVAALGGLELDLHALVLGGHARLLHVKPFLLVLLYLRQACRMSRCGQRICLHLSAVDLRLGHEARPRLREVEWFRGDVSLFTGRQHSAVGIVDSSCGLQLQRLEDGLQLLGEALQLAYDLLLDVLDIVELAPLHLDPLLQVICAQSIAQQLHHCRVRAAEDQLPELRDADLLEPEEQHVGHDRVQGLLRPNCGSRASVQEARNEQLQELLVSNTPVEDLVNKLLLNLLNGLVLEGRGIIDVCIHGGFLGVERVEHLDALLDQLRAAQAQRDGHRAPWPMGSSGMAGGPAARVGQSGPVRAVT
mmetsp:Transcript_104685/g.296265  ORF Transcript_104685/g.296265 Transcript_104685/m.296265 type:complete len:432 (+) Transcript_104685:1179-2474(+)